MLAGFLMIAVISSSIWTYRCTGAPTVTLTADSSPYFDIGGSIVLTCSISEDVNSNTAYLIKDGKPYVWIRINSSSSCGWTQLTVNDTHDYNITCDQRMTVYIIINGAVAADHNAEWSCDIQCPSCDCLEGPCVSTSSFRTALRVPVSSVQLKDGTGQQLVTPVSVLNGSAKDFQCGTSPNGSRPRAMFNWYKRSENQSPILIQDQSISTPGPRPEFDLSISTSYSTLTLMASRSYQNMYIYCEAQDETKRGNFSRSREVQLNIVYPPVVQVVPSTSSFNVTEGSIFEFRCNVTEANPMPQLDDYSWFLGGRVIKGQTRSTLEFLNIQRSQDGMYQCMARNAYGIGNSSTIHLNVQYGAGIVNMSVDGGNMVNENSSAIFKCHVDSNPPSTITWLKESSSSSIIKNEFGVLQSQYTIESAECLDMGNYTCSAYNGVWTTAKGRLELFVRCHPRTDYRLHLETKIYRKLHEAAVLRYTVISYPPPTFSWTFRGNGSENTVLPVSASQHDNGQQSELQITSPGITDFGIYSVVANNSLSTSATQDFEIIQADGAYNGKNIPYSAVAGGIGAGVVVILVLAVVLFIWIRNKHHNHNGINQDKIERPKPASELVFNLVYDTSGHVPGPSANISVTGEEYAKVDKHKIKESSMDEPSNVYAQVNKRKKKLKKEAHKGKHGKTSRGDIYENADQEGKPSKPDNLHQTSSNEKTELCNESVYEDTRVTTYNGPLRSKEGLLYADLMMASSSRKHGMDILQGKENKTEYAEIAYGKRGEPLPESDR